jgi:predicted Ser/Thr protein kinase
MLDDMVDFSAELEAFNAGAMDLDTLRAKFAAFLNEFPGQRETLSTLLADRFHDGSLSPQAFAALSAVAQKPEEPFPDVSDKTVIRPREIPPLPTAGKVLNNRFVLEDELGRGGMGIVYKARDLRKEEARDRDMYVAVKVLNADFKQFPDACIDLQRECKKAQRLAHPNIVTVYDFDRDDDIFYMTMEILEGESLEQLMKRLRPGGMPFKTALPIIRGMVQGLSYAHELGIVHSDFKPGNVFVLNQGGKAKILDFGLATAARRPGQNVGNVSLYVRSWEGLTPAYASPEMCDRVEGKDGDDIDSDPADDIYGLACVVYELLAGQHPFAQIQANLARNQQLTPKPIATIRRRQNAALVRALSFDRRERTPTAEQFFAELAEDAGFSRKKVVAGVVGLLLVLLLMGGAYYFFAAPDKRPPVQAPVPVAGQTDAAAVVPAVEKTMLPSPAAEFAPAVEPEPAPEPAPAAPPELVHEAVPDTEMKAVSAAVLPPVASEISPELQARIEALLGKAEQEFSEGRLVTPDRENACINYQAILDIDPENQSAQAGLVRVLESLQQAVLRTLERDDFCQVLPEVQSSLAKVESALHYYAGNYQLQDLKQRILEKVDDCLLQSMSND